MDCLKKKVRATCAIKPMQPEVTATLATPAAVQEGSRAICGDMPRERESGSNAARPEPGNVICRIIHAVSLDLKFRTAVVAF